MEDSGGEQHQREDSDRRACRKYDNRLLERFRWAYECKRHPYNVIPSGEKAMYQTLHLGGRQHKFDTKCEIGIWVGVRAGNPKKHVATLSSFSPSRSV